MPRLNFDIFFRDHGARRGIGELGDETDRTRDRMQRFHGAATAGAAVAGAAIVGFGVSSAKAYVEAEAAQNKLQSAFDKFPKLADTNIEALQELNGELAKKVKYDDDATSSGQAVLAGFNLTGKQITQLTPLLQDYASKTGKDLPTAARDLGKATMGSGAALKKIGIDFKDAGSQGANFDQLVGGLRTQVGGFAEKEGKTAAGQTAILENQFGEIQETVGAKLVPVLTMLGAKLLTIIDFVGKNINVIGPLVAVFGTLVGIIWAVNTATKAYTAVQAALNVVLLLNPIGLVIAAIALLVAGLVIAYKKSDTFRAVVQAAFRATVRAGLDMAGGVVHAAEKAFGWMPGIGPKLKTAAREFDAFKDRVNRSLDKVRDEQVTVRINTAAKIYGTKGGHYEGGTFIPNRAAGGAIRRAMGGYTDDKVPMYMGSYDEHVWTAKEVHAAGGHGSVERMRRGVLNGYANGGRVVISLIPNVPGQGMSNRLQRDIEHAREAVADIGTSRLQSYLKKMGSGPFSPGLIGATNFAKAQAGKPYIWGGVGPRGYDCSGFMSAITNVAKGANPYHRLFATGSFPAAGFIPGPGAFMIGSHRGNPGHMAGTINGVNVESSGSVGAHYGRSARGARNSLFGGNIYHLRGFAKGGAVGDPPYDFLNPYGREYLGEDIRKALLMDQGGMLQPGFSAVNRTGRPERILTNRQTDAFEKLVQAISYRGSNPFSNAVGNRAFNLSDFIDTVSHKSKNPLARAVGNRARNVDDFAGTISNRASRSSTPSTSGGDSCIDYNKLANALTRSMRNVRIEMDGKVVGKVMGVQADRLGRGH